MAGKNKKYILISAFTVLLSLILIIFWIFTINNLNNLKGDNLEMAKSLEAAEKKIENIKNLETLFDELKEERGKVRASIVLKEDLVRFIENLESLAEKAGVDMRIRSIQIEENSEPLLSVESNGDFNEVYYFIEMLESLPYFISFDRLIIQKNSSVEKEYKWTSKIELRVLSYYENFQ